MTRDEELEALTWLSVQAREIPAAQTIIKMLQLYYDRVQALKQQLADPECIHT